MTAVSAGHGTGVRLICDGCGTSTASDGCGMHDAEVVYVAMATSGWTGTAFARGPHHCPACAADIVAFPVGPRQRPTGDDRISLRLDATAAIVTVTGDIDLDAAVELWSVLEEAAAARLIVVVDLTDAGTVDSIGVGALVRGRNTVQRRRGELVLAGASTFLQAVLRTMRLNTAFPIFRTVDHALTVTRSRRAVPTGTAC
ncbi:STAS domain-containing protein [Actinoplanes sp. G11-F43]|uniref:STAS domain-containing protein n=1 Tax=Actinoplanes sp. G11-F43 TaxID=3424130 RepID=UPI003D34D8BA